MSQIDLWEELERNKIQITPGATEVLKNSNVPSSMLLTEIRKKWKGKSKVVTVKDAIEIMLNSDKYAKISKSVQMELKTRFKETITVPRLYRKTYFTLKQFGEPVTPGQVAQITHRKTSTERVYLDKLVNEGYVKKEYGRKNRNIYSILEMDS